MFTNLQTDTVGLYLASVLFIIFLWNVVLVYTDAMFSKVTTATVFARRLREENSLERQDSKKGSVYPPRKHDASIDAALDRRKHAVRQAMDYLTEKERNESGGQWDLARRKLEADRARQYLEEKEWKKEQEILALEREKEKEILFDKQRIQTEHEKMEKEQAAAAKRERQRQQELELQKQREFLMHARNYDDTGLLWPPQMPMKMRHPSSREDSIEYYSSDDSDDDRASRAASVRQQSTESTEEEPIMGHLARAMMRAEEKSAERLTSRPEGPRPWKSPETTAEIHHYGVRTLPFSSMYKATSPQEAGSSDQLTSPEGPSGDELSSNDEGRKVKFGKKSNGQGIKSSKKTSSGSESSISEGILKSNGKADSPGAAHGGARPKTKLSAQNVDDKYKKKLGQNSKQSKPSLADRKERSQSSPDFKLEKKTDKHFGFTLGQSDIEKGYLHHMGLDVLAVDPDDSPNWKEKVERHERNLASQKYQISPSQQYDRSQVKAALLSSDSIGESSDRPVPTPKSPRSIVEIPGNLDGQLEELTKQFRAGRQKANEQIEESPVDIEQRRVGDSRELTDIEEGEEECDRKLSRDSSPRRKHQLKSPRSTKEGPILVPPSVMKEAIKSHGAIGVMSPRVGIPEADKGKAEPGTVLLKQRSMGESSSVSALDRLSSSKSPRSRHYSENYDSRSSAQRRQLLESGAGERRGSSKLKPSQSSDFEQTESDKHKSNLSREHSRSLKERRPVHSHTSSHRRKSEGCYNDEDGGDKTESFQGSQRSLRSKRPGIPDDLKKREKYTSDSKISTGKLEGDRKSNPRDKSPSKSRTYDTDKSKGRKLSPRSPRAGIEKSRNTKVQVDPSSPPPKPPQRRHRSTSRQRNADNTSESQQKVIPKIDKDHRTRLQTSDSDSRLVGKSKRLDSCTDRLDAKEVTWAKDVERGREGKRLDPPQRPKRRRDESRSIERGETRDTSHRSREVKRDSVIGTSKSEGSIKSLMKTEPIREGLQVEKHGDFPKRPARRSRSRGHSSERKQRMPMKSKDEQGPQATNKEEIETKKSPETTKEPKSPERPPRSPRHKQAPVGQKKIDTSRTSRVQHEQQEPEIKEKSVIDHQNVEEAQRSLRAEKEKGIKEVKSPHVEEPSLSSEKHDTFNIPKRPERRSRRSERKLRKSESTDERKLDKTEIAEKETNTKRRHSFETVELKITVDEAEKTEEKENIPESNRTTSAISPTIEKSMPQETQESDLKEIPEAEQPELVSSKASIKTESAEQPSDPSKKKLRSSISTPQTNRKMELPVPEHEESPKVTVLSSPDTGPSSIEPDFPERPPRKTKMKKKKVHAERRRVNKGLKTDHLSEQDAELLDNDHKIPIQPEESRLVNSKTQVVRKSHTEGKLSSLQKPTIVQSTAHREELPNIGLSPMSQNKQSRSPLSVIRSQSLDRAKPVQRSPKERGGFFKHRANIKEISNMIEEITQKTVTLMRHPGFTSFPGVKRELAVDGKSKSKSRDPSRSPLIRERRSKSQDRMGSRIPVVPNIPPRKAKTPTLAKKSEAISHHQVSFHRSSRIPQKATSSIKSHTSSESPPEPKPRPKHAAKLAKLHIPKPESEAELESPEAFLQKPVTEIMMDIEKSPIFHAKIVHPTKISENLLSQQLLVAQDKKRSPGSEQQHIEDVSPPTAPPRSDSLPKCSAEAIDKIDEDKQGKVISVEESTICATSKIDRKEEQQSDVAKQNICEARSGSQPFTVAKRFSSREKLKSPRHSPRPELPRDIIESTITHHVTEVQNIPLSVTKKVHPTPTLSTEIERKLPLSKTEDVGVKLDDSLSDFSDSLSVSIGSPTLFTHAETVHSPGGPKPPHKPPYTLWGEDGWVRISPERTEHHPHFPNHTPPIGDKWDSRRGSMKSDSTPEVDLRSSVDKKSEFISESESEAKSEDLEKVLEIEEDSKVGSISKENVLLEQTNGDFRKPDSENDEEMTLEKIDSLEKSLKQDVISEMNVTQISGTTDQVLTQERAPSCTSEKEKIQMNVDESLTKSGVTVEEKGALYVEKQRDQETLQDLETSEEPINEAGESLQEAEQKDNQEVPQISDVYEHKESEPFVLPDSPAVLGEDISNIDEATERRYVNREEKAVECDLLPETKDETTECDLSDAEIPEEGEKEFKAEDDETDWLDDDVFEPDDHDTEIKPEKLEYIVARDEDSKPHQRAEDSQIEESPGQSGTNREEEDEQSSKVQNNGQNITSRDLQSSIDKELDIKTEAEDFEIEASKKEKEEDIEQAMKDQSENMRSIHQPESESSEEISTKVETEGKPCINNQEHHFVGEEKENDKHLKASDRDDISEEHFKGQDEEYAKVKPVLDQTVTQDDRNRSDDLQSDNAVLEVTDADTTSPDTSVNQLLVSPPVTLPPQVVTEEVIASDETKEPKAEERITEQHACSEDTTPTVSSEIKVSAKGQDMTEQTDEEINDNISKGRSSSVKSEVNQVDSVEDSSPVAVFLSSTKAEGAVLESINNLEDQQPLDESSDRVEQVVDTVSDSKDSLEEECGRTVQDMETLRITAELGVSEHLKDRTSKEVTDTTVSEHTIETPSEENIEIKDTVAMVESFENIQDQASDIIDESTGNETELSLETTLEAEDQEHKVGGNSDIISEMCGDKDIQDNSDNNVNKAITVESVQNLCPKVYQETDNNKREEVSPTSAIEKIGEETQDALSEIGERGSDDLLQDSNDGTTIENIMLDKVSGDEPTSYIESKVKFSENEKDLSQENGANGLDQIKIPEYLSETFDNQSADIPKVEGESDVKLIENVQPTVESPTQIDDTRHETKSENISEIQGNVSMICGSESVEQTSPGDVPDTNVEKPVKDHISESASEVEEPLQDQTSDSIVEKDVSESEQSEKQQSDVLLCDREAVKDPVAKTSVLKVAEIKGVSEECTSAECVPDTNVKEPATDHISESVNEGEEPLQDPTSDSVAEKDISESEKSAEQKSEVLLCDIEAVQDAAAETSVLQVDKTKDVLDLDSTSDMNSSKCPPVSTEEVTSELESFEDQDQCQKEGSKKEGEVIDNVTTHERDSESLVETTKEKVQEEGDNTTNQEISVVSDYELDAEELGKGEFENADQIFQSSEDVGPDTISKVPIGEYEEDGKVRDEDKAEESVHHEVKDITITQEVCTESVMEEVDVDLPKDVVQETERKECVHSETVSGADAEIDSNSGESTSEVEGAKYKSKDIAETLSKIKDIQDKYEEISSKCEEVKIGKVIPHSTDENLLVALPQGVDSQGSIKCEGSSDEIKNKGDFDNSVPEGDSNVAQADKCMVSEVVKPEISENIPDQTQTGDDGTDTPPEDEGHS